MNRRAPQHAFSDGRPDLSPRQRDTLGAITRITTEQGCPPTHRQLAVALGLRSVHGVAEHLRAPERKGYIKRPVLERDGFRCVACGATPASAQLDVDHILALSLGGTTEEDNLQTLCADCNEGKRVALRESQARLRLLNGGRDA